MPDCWFLPAPTTLPGSRIDATLGLRRVLRMSHDRVVPGIGGLRFVRQASWACAAIHLVHSRQGSAFTNIRVANALEALACKLVFRSGGPSDEEKDRVRGVTRLSINHNEPAQWAYSHLREPRNYVSQPLRQSTTASLTDDAGLGFVAAGPMRFNTMQLSERGHELAAAFLGQRVSRSLLRSVLEQWLSASNPQASGKSILAAPEALLGVMRPRQAGSQECVTVQRCLALPLNKQQAERLQGDTQRRARFYHWMAELGQTEDPLTMADIERRLHLERTVAADAHWVACQENFYLERFVHGARAVLATLIAAFQEGAATMSVTALLAREAIQEACAQYRLTGAAYAHFVQEYPRLRPDDLPLDPLQDDPWRILEGIVAQAPLLLHADGNKLVAGPLMRTPPNVVVDRDLLGMRDMRDGPWIPKRLRQLQGLTLECARD